MASSLSNLADNLSKVVHQTKCKYGHDNKKCEVFGIKYKGCECCLEYTSLKDDLIEYKYLCCNKNYFKNFDENLKNRFAKCTNFVTMVSISLFFLLQKDVYPYEYMDDWEKLN